MSCNAFPSAPLPLCSCHLSLVTCHSLRGVHQRTSDSQKRNRAVGEVAKKREKQAVFENSPVARQLAIACRIRAVGGTTDKRPTAGGFSFGGARVRGGVFYHHLPAPG